MFYAIYYLRRQEAVLVISMPSSDSTLISNLYKQLTHNSLIVRFYRHILDLYSTISFLF